MTLRSYLDDSVRIGQKPRELSVDLWIEREPGVTAGNFDIACPRLARPRAGVTHDPV